MPNGIGSRLAQARLDKLPGRTKEADCVCELIGLRIDLIWVALTVWIVYWNFALSLSSSSSSPGHRGRVRPPGLLAPHIL